MDLSIRHANLKIMLGGSKSVLPNTTRKTRLMTTEYNFKKTDFCVIKQKRPAARKRADDTKGRQLKELFFLPSPVFKIPPALDCDVALKKKANARTIMHRERILTGSFKTTRQVKTKTG